MYQNREIFALMLVILYILQKAPFLGISYTQGHVSLFKTGKCLVLERCLSCFDLMYLLQ